MIKMRFYIFAISIAFLNAHPTGERVQNGTPWSKLKHYQTLTGISDEEMMAILRKSPMTKSSDRQGIFLIILLVMIIYLKVFRKFACLLPHH